MAVVKCSECGKPLTRLPDIRKKRHEHGCPEEPQAPQAKPSAEP